MDFEKLHRLIHNLTSDQKTNFKKYVKGKIGKLTWKLYERIAMASSCDKEAERKIQHYEFSHPRTYNHHRNKLTEWIIKSLAKYDSHCGFNKELVKVAFLYEADKLGTELLEGEIEKLVGKEAFSQLFDLLSFIEELKHFYLIDIKLREGLEDLIYVNEELERFSMLNSLVVKLRNAAKRTANDRITTAKHALASIDQPFRSRLNSDLACKVRMNSAYLLGQFDRALEFGEELMDRLKSWPEKYPSAYVAKQMRFFVANAVLLNNRDIAIRYGMEISRLKPSNPWESREVEKNAIVAGNAVAVYFADVEIINRNLEALDRAITYFDEPQIPSLLYYNLGKAYHYNAMGIDAIRCLQKARSLNTKKVNILKWEPQVMLAISHHNAGDIELVGYLMRSANHAAKKLESEYPRLAISIVKTMLLGRESNKNQIVEKKMKEVQMLFSNQEEKRASNGFEVDVWLEATYRSVPMIQVLNERRLNQIPNISSLEIA